MSEPWGGDISARWRMRALLKTPEATEPPKMSEGSSLKLAIQSFPFAMDPRLQALLAMSDEDAATEFARLAHAADDALGALNPAYRVMLGMR